MKNPIGLLIHMKTGVIILLSITMMIHKNILICAWNGSQMNSMELKNGANIAPTITDMKEMNGKNTMIPA